MSKEIVTSLLWLSAIVGGIYSALSLFIKWTNPDKGNRSFLAFIKEGLTGFAYGAALPLFFLSIGWVGEKAIGLLPFWALMAIGALFVAGFVVLFGSMLMGFFVRR